MKECYLLFEHEFSIKTGILRFLLNVLQEEIIY